MRVGFLTWVQCLLIVFEKFKSTSIKDQIFFMEKYLYDHNIKIKTIILYSILITYFFVSGEYLFIHLHLHPWGKTQHYSNLPPTSSSASTLNFYLN